MENVLLTQREITAYLESLDDGLVCRRDCVLLPELETVCSLLNVGLRDIWEANRSIRSKLPTSKTALKFFSKGAENLSWNSRVKFARKLPISRQCCELTDAQFEKGYSVQTAVHWLGVLASNSSNPAVLDYWKPKLYELSDLSGAVLNSLPTMRDRLSAYDSADVVRMLGCPASRQLLPKLLAELEEEREFERSDGLQQLLAADTYAVLLRLVAWLIADREVANWESAAQDGTNNSIPGLWAIPKWCSETRAWTNPMDISIERLAILAGWAGAKQKSVTYLGKFWASKIGKDDSSSIRLLRNWVQLKGGRPSFSKLHELIQFCIRHDLQGKGALSSDMENASWSVACFYRFAETTSRLIRDFQKDEWPTDLLNSMMGVYETEYRTARSLLVRPIEG